MLSRFHPLCRPKFNKASRQHLQLAGIQLIHTAQQENIIQYNFNMLKNVHIPFRTMLWPTADYKFAELLYVTWIFESIHLRKSISLANKTLTKSCLVNSIKYLLILLISITFGIFCRQYHGNLIDSKNSENQDNNGQNRAILLLEQNQEQQRNLNTKNKISQLFNITIQMI